MLVMIVVLLIEKIFEFWVVVLVEDMIELGVCVIFEIFGDEEVVL